MRFQSSNKRRGVILMVVLALLTLFAVVGIAFVLYAQAEATSARIAREGETAQRADMPPEECLAMFLGQFLYDAPDDLRGVGSALRGYSLGRGLYGYNYVYNATTQQYTLVNNTAPYTGTGRLHWTNPKLGADEWQLINYTWFSNDPTGLNGAVRDPERYGVRTNPSVPGTVPYAGGYNVPYTYADINNLYLGAMRASDGMILAHSFHRDYTGFGNLDPSNPNWNNKTDPTMKYKVLRPRPAEHPNFPLPVDAGGDVKNVIDSPGYYDPISGKICNNDSFWMDIGAPVQTAPDGTKYKMLVAPFIAGLDGKVNVNAHGNIRGAGNTHMSNQGWGPWAVNLGLVLNANSGAEWPNLFIGRAISSSQHLLGRYGPTLVPAPLTVAPAGTMAHEYAQGDLDECNNGPGGIATGPLQLQGTQPSGGGAQFSCFPNFPAGYDNGSKTERTNHPMIYNVKVAYPPNPSTPGLYNLRFPTSSMERLLRRSDTNSSALVSQLERLLPLNFDNPKNLTGSFIRRNLVTTDSADLDAPGLTPWVWNPTTSPYQVTPVGSIKPPKAILPMTFPTLPLTGPTAPPTGSEFSANWRAATLANLGTILQLALRRLDLNRALTEYPTISNPALRYDSSALLPTFQQATADRQNFANDIYRRLLAVTGVSPVLPANQATPLPTDLEPRRWLAQLAVNIVDFIDDDDISTPFNFYNVNDGLPVATIGATNPADGNPLYWVFGTELPRVVLNEALLETPNTLTTIATPVLPPTVKVWVELYNTMQVPPATTPLQSQDGQPVPLSMPAQPTPVGLPPQPNAYAPYRIVVDLYGPVQSNEDVLGVPPILGLRKQTQDADFLSTATTVGTVPPKPGSVPSAISPQGYFLLGPPVSTNAKTLFKDPFVSRKNGGTVPGITPVIRTLDMMYTRPFVKGVTTDERTLGVTVYLRRLANPHIPHNASPAAGIWYNPYITVDYLHKVPLRGTVNNPTTIYARGKRQPYAGYSKLVNPTLPPVTKDSPVTNQMVTSPQTVFHTFGSMNRPAPQEIPAAPLPYPPPNPPASSHYDWLTHLDRQLISPMELLQVSGYAPYMLTQQFMLSDNPLLAVPPTTAALTRFMHRAPWYDTTRRLYRVFEFLETHDMATGNYVGGRTVGKININDIWDLQTFQAIIDPQLGNWITQTAVTQKTTPQAIVTAMFTQMMTLRSPGNGKGGYYPGATNYDVSRGGPLPANYNPNYNPTTYPYMDRPFLSTATGISQAVPGSQYPVVQDIDDTLLRSHNAGGGLASLRLLQTPGDLNTTTYPNGVHPYLQDELLTKVFGRLTTRGNVFAVWLTVGFFEVTNPNISPPTLGAEVGRSEGRQVRHRMFAIVDRSNMTQFTTTNAVAVQLPIATGATPTFNAQMMQYRPQSVSLANMSGVIARSGIAWALQTGMLLTYEPGGPNEETVVVQPGAKAGQFVAQFMKAHAVGAVVLCRGNPGPWKRYDPRLDPGVVLYYNIID